MKYETSTRPITLSLILLKEAGHKKAEYLVGCEIDHSQLIGYRRLSC